MTHRTRDEDDSAVEQDADDPADQGSESGDERRVRERDSADRDTAGADGSDDAAHLADVEDGCGCAEVWEHLSERRAADSD